MICVNSNMCCCVRRPVSLVLCRSCNTNHSSTDRIVVNCDNYKLSKIDALQHLPFDYSKHMLRCCKLRISTFNFANCVLIAKVKCTLNIWSQLLEIASCWYENILEIYFSRNHYPNQNPAAHQAAWQRLIFIMGNYNSVRQHRFNETLARYHCQLRMTLKHVEKLNDYMSMA